MNILKYGSKLVSVGLLSLSMSAGFSGLAFAQTVRETLIVNPNPIVLDNSAASVAPDSTSFSAVIDGTGLAPLDLYTVNINAPLPCAVTITPRAAVSLLGGAQVANNDGRATFGVTGVGCRPGTYTITSADTTTGLPGPSTTLTLLPPSPSTATTTSVPRQFWAHPCTVC